MKTKLFCLIFSALTLYACAQSKSVTITGTVLEEGTQVPLAGVSIFVKNTKKGTVTDAKGHYSLQAKTDEKLTFSFVGYQSAERSIGKDSVIHISLKASHEMLQEAVVITGRAAPNAKMQTFSTQPLAAPMPGGLYDAQLNTEEYKSLNENIFHDAKKSPLTTFSIDVDRAAYSNVRRMLNLGQFPQRDMVRIEEMINYFDYDYPQPQGEHPVAIHTEVSDSPWNKGLKLVQIGLQAKTIPTNNLPASNLVFLVDVSGSMNWANKLPLVKEAFKLLVDQLRPHDRVAIVVYAGAAGTVLPSTPGNQTATIKDALDKLSAGGSTAGGEGIKLAYQIAQEHFIKGGNNRVILASDGDFNVGVSSEGELQQIVEEKRKSGIYLSVLGFGMGNYKDNKMETLADKGNGNYAYIDNLQEAQKVFVHEFGGTLFTVAKDVKLQLEFNPKFVKGYRLIGYENRMLKNEEFHDDKKDAGEMGSGHTVTALYELIPAGAESAYLPKTDDLKYQKTTESATGSSSDELLTVKLRYKQPDSELSRLFEVAVRDTSIPFNSTSDHFRFAAAVAEWGLLLRNSEFKGAAGYEQVIQLAQGALAKDPEGYRAEFVRLVKLAQSLGKQPKEAVSRKNE
ncbi:YfbK domain-containing protein [Runella slithyformis]|uniref:von Willebrand factor type A n=1 Tax=Runella slithyformis (strain ATCC 29530 / DSM 19594 / LMG 11500 / NCIMB 11436 / LSU 4) TaxID=761193 RepID=A0A7U4E4V6_RUNSL|nr:von Willebrand factor type A domain-containing protein [Runella slithyformis]AEI47548.1 von Willebrand factor type A [Runella slithyformis DSM 19594]